MHMGYVAIAAGMGACSSMVEHLTGNHKVVNPTMVSRKKVQYVKRSTRKKVQKSEKTSNPTEKRSNFVKYEKRSTKSEKGSNFFAKKGPIVAKKGPTYAKKGPIATENTGRNYCSYLP